MSRTIPAVIKTEKKQRSHYPLTDETMRKVIQNKKRWNTYQEHVFLLKEDRQSAYEKLNKEYLLVKQYLNVNAPESSLRDFARTRWKKTLSDFHTNDNFRTTLGKVSQETKQEVYLLDLLDACMIPDSMLKKSK
jgi:uncharacterized protein YqeY